MNRGARRRETRARINSSYLESNILIKNNDSRSARHFEMTRKIIPVTGKVGQRGRKHRDIETIDLSRTMGKRSSLFVWYTLHFFFFLQTTSEFDRLINASNARARVLPRKPRGMKYRNVCLCMRHNWLFPSDIPFGKRGRDGRRFLSRLLENVIYYELRDRKLPPIINYPLR